MCEVGVDGRQLEYVPGFKYFLRFVKDESGTEGAVFWGKGAR